MANLTWRSGSSATDTSGGATSLNVGAPAGVQTGDLLVGFFFAAVLAPTAAPAITLPTGWTQIRTDVQNGVSFGAANARVTLAYKVATGGDSYTFSCTPGSFLTGLIGAWDNPAASPLMAGTTRATLGAVTSFPATGLTTTQANQLLIYCAFTDEGTATWTPPTGFTERLDAFAATMADAIQASAGASGSKTGNTSIAGTAGAAYLIPFFSEAPAAQGLSVPTIAAGSSVAAPTVDHATPAAQGLAGGTVAAGSSVAAPSLAPGAVARTNGTIAAGSTANAPTVAAGAAARTGGTIAAGSSVAAPTVAAGTLTVTMPTIAAGSAVAAPSLAADGVDRTLDAIASGATLGAPTLAPGAIARTLGTVASGSSVAAPDVAPAGTGVNLGTVASAAAAHGPTVTAGSVSLSLGTVPATSNLAAPAFEQGAGVQELTLGTIAAGSTTAAPAFAHVLALGTVTSTAQAFAVTPEVDGAIGVPHLAAGSLAHAPSLSPGAITRAMPAIASTATATGPTLALGLSLGTIPSTTQVGAPTLSRSDGMPTIAPGSQIFGPTLTPGAVTLALGTVAATATVGSVLLAFGSPIHIIQLVAEAAGRPRVSGEVMARPTVGQESGLGGLS